MLFCSIYVRFILSKFGHNGSNSVELSFVKRKENSVFVCFFLWEAYYIEIVGGVLRDKLSLSLRSPEIFGVLASKMRNDGQRCFS